jgi:hypothetical protein
MRLSNGTTKEYISGGLIEENNKMSYDELTDEEFSLLTEVIKKLCSDKYLYCNNDFKDYPFIVRLRKCDFDFNRYLRMHIDTCTSLPRIPRQVIEVIRVKYEDLPLHINQDSNDSSSVLSNMVVMTRLKNGI